MSPQVCGEALADADAALQAMPGWAKRTGTYVGCMFVDHMSLLQRSYGYASTGAVMTGAPLPNPLSFLCGSMAKHVRDSLASS